MAEGNEERLRGVVENKFGGEAANCEVFVADGIEEVGVGRGAERARDINISIEGNIFEVRNRGNSGVDGEGG